MNVSWSVAVAAVFLWLGMVLAISFLEAPLKFRAPGVTLALGLGIGRLVFRALNTCEVVLALVVAAGLYGSQASTARWTAFAVAAVALTARLGVWQLSRAAEKEALQAWLDNLKNGDWSKPTGELEAGVRLLAEGYARATVAARRDRAGAQGEATTWPR